jgi:N-acetylglutamate synthase-like GNAT family acetyltransferase
MSEIAPILRKANTADLDAIKRIADDNRQALGFIRRSALDSSVQNGWLIVAEDAGQIIGFVNYRHRQDRQTTLYEICVAEPKRRCGVGIALVKALSKESGALGKDRIRLKAPSDLPANIFYRNIGFTLVVPNLVDKRLLNVWETTLAEEN